jgi:hypothetical protein
MGYRSTVAYTIRFQGSRGDDDPESQAIVLYIHSRSEVKGDDGWCVY